MKGEFNNSKISKIANIIEMLFANNGVLLEESFGSNIFFLKNDYNFKTTLGIQNNDLNSTNTNAPLNSVYSENRLIVLLKHLSKNNDLNNLKINTKLFISSLVELIYNSYICYKNAAQKIKEFKIHEKKSTIDETIQILLNKIEKQEKSGHLKTQSSILKLSLKQFTYIPIGEYDFLIRYNKLEKGIYQHEIPLTDKCLNSDFKINSFGMSDYTTPKEYFSKPNNQVFINNEIKDETYSTSTTNKFFKFPSNSNKNSNKFAAIKNDKLKEKYSSNQKDDIYFKKEFTSLIFNSINVPDYDLFSNEIFENSKQISKKNQQLGFFNYALDDQYNDYDFEEINFSSFFDNNSAKKPEDYSGTNLISLQFELTKDKEIFYISDNQYLIDIFLLAIDDLIDLNKKSFNLNIKINTKAPNESLNTISNINEKSIRSNVQNEIECLCNANFKIDDLTRMSILNRVTQIFQANITVYAHYYHQVVEILEMYFSEVSDKVLEILNEDEKVISDENCNCGCKIF